MTDLGVPECLSKPNFKQIPEIKLRFDIDSTKISELANEIIETSKDYLNQLVDTPPEQCNFENIVAKLADLETWRSTYIQSCVFPQFVSQKKDVVEASVRATEKLDAFEIELSMREDIYQLVKRVEEKERNLEGEDKRLLEKMVLGYKRIGMELDENNKNLLKRKLTRLSELGIKFSKNIGDDKTHLLFEVEELEGLPKEFIDNLESTTVEGVRKYKLTMKYPDVYPTLDYAKIPETRKKVEFAFGARVSENVQILEEAIKLRLEIANLLKYKTHSDFGLEIKMAKTVENVYKFLNDLREKLSPVAEKELKELLKFKKEECPDANEIYSYDINIKDYFPIEHVTRAMLDIYQTVLGLKFTKVDDPQPWVDDKSLVSLFEVKDSENSHAACFPIQPAYKNENSYQLPVAAMVANFTKPLKEVFINDTRFCGSAFSGTTLSNIWCWDSESLKRLSSHYETKESLPDDLIAPLVKSKNSCVGIFNLRQLFFGFFDMEIHSITDSNKKVDTTEIYNKLRKEITFVPGQSGTFPQATFGHMMGGYDAGYYGYLWSQVYSADMFYSKFKESGNIINKEVGSQYRKFILGPGGSMYKTFMFRDGMNELVNFLGRKPNSDAFIHDILGE